MDMVSIHDRYVYIVDDATDAVAASIDAWMERTFFIIILFSFLCGGYYSRHSNYNADRCLTLCDDDDARLMFSFAFDVSTVKTSISKFLIASSHFIINVVDPDIFFIDGL
ncbi:hypothetical protein DERP_002703 [Dermatophagoides pteronyssinus]|uniref:Uncharacterized protein n=1 Tax=Dermatophagoides pteronyssinus TaxID=6956 RepID=A0ABQ8JVF1_DERPT|nr:hypothetical protein DERP_002703 [Dermatophagoides pteronyssinus]